ncbi:hypothetical protein A1O1_07001 [Capronia coronata CBS 617.96]|uniref:N-acetyltransferase domain-containing protein n=1 Tax=Capronia coronata CBS 617.96 TaxID=1182541 RepID=W9YMA1_9EURO|nr:uncharacterized protein A1O1_07001 [Capronia coronata CBS 617.96]EXJ83379.1 hypothetical protein A1O1_07001 [Capronia coronata CBS 617.96]
MPLKLHVLSTNDPDDLALIPTMAQIHAAAWLTNDLYKAIYHGPPSSHAGIVEANRQRHLKSITSNPSAHFAVVLDDAIAGSTSDQVIAWIKYDIFESAQAEKERKDTSERKWPPYTNMTLVDHFWTMITASRKRLGAALGPHLNVDLVATSPDHHRRGAGRMLMDHVTREADRLGLPATLEGSPDGFKLYSAVGFEAIDEVWVDLLRFENGVDKGEDWSSRRDRTAPGWYKQVVMVRQARKPDSK